MIVHNIAIDEIKIYENNPRKNDQAVEGVKKSIKEFGFKVPMIITSDKVIIAGHTRLKAAQQLGYKEVPCVIADDLTEDQIRAFRIADNKTAETAEWDFELLKAELEGLEDMFTGFDEAEMQEMFGEEVEVEEDDYEIIPPEEPKAKLGDIYKLGNHRLMCGDSTDKETVSKLMNGVKADMVFTDPPYGMNAVSKSGVLSEKYKTDIMNDDDNTVAINSFNLCKNYFKDAKQVWWGANYYTECLPSAECWIVWDKNNGGSDQTDCELAWSNFRSVVRQFTMSSEKINRVHPTQKPLNLISQIFKKFDKNNEYNNVVDLFGGSGSTLIACEQLERSCYMMELDPKYIDVIIDRWENYTGEKGGKIMIEKVNPHHPDKVADRIAGAIVDIGYKHNKDIKIAVEVLIGHEKCYVIVETNSGLNEDEVLEAINRIAGLIDVDLIIEKQDEHLQKNQEGKVRCGDNGIFKGVPLTEEEKELSKIARNVYKKYGCDGKYILANDRLIICQSNAQESDLRRLYPKAEINPLGYWTGGTNVDTGATNRKLGSDMAQSVTGGGLHGKDLSKADVSVNIYAFLKAQETGKTQEFSCAIGDDTIDGKPYEEIVEIARDYINKLGGFEKFAEWGLF